MPELLLLVAQTLGRVAELGAIARHKVGLRGMAVKRRQLLEILGSLFLV